MGALWFLVTQRLAGEGLGRAVPACLVLTFVCLVLAVIDATTGLLPDRITYPAFPVVGSLLLGASLRLGDLGRLGCVCLGGRRGRRLVRAGIALAARHCGWTT